MRPGMFDRIDPTRASASYSYPDGSHAWSSHPQQQNISVRPINPDQENTSLFQTSPASSSQQQSTGSLDWGMDQMNQLTNQMNQQLSEISTRIEEDLSVENITRELSQFMEGFDSRMQAFYGQQKVSAEQQLRADAAGMRDARPYVTRQRTEDVEQRIEQAYVDSMMQANMMYADKMLQTRLAVADRRTQAHTAFASLAVNAVGVVSQFVGQMVSERQANYRAQLQANVAMAQIRAQQASERRQMQFNERMVAEERAWNEKMFDLQLEVARDERASQTEKIDALINAAREELENSTRSESQTAGRVGPDFNLSGDDFNMGPLSLDRVYGSPEADSEGGFFNTGPLSLGM